MSAGLVVLFFFVVIGLILVFGVGLPTFLNIRDSLSGAQKDELRSLRSFKQDVRRLAARNADINPELATQIQGLLYDIETKELG